MAKASSVTEGIISDNEEEFFLDDSDIIDEIVLDDEDLPDVEDDDEENVSEDMLYAEPDDAVDLFARHSGHRDSVSCLSFSKDGQLLASGGLDACVKIWDIMGNLKCTFQGLVEGHEFEWVRWHPSAHLVLAGCTDTTVWLWNADKGALLNVFCGHGKSICTGSSDATLRIWNPRSGQGNVVKGYTKASALTCLTYTPDSNLALTGAENGVLSVANIANEKMDLNDSMPWVATGGADEKLVIWDLQHSACRNIFEYQDEITCLNWLGESMLVASGCGDGQIIVCDTRSGEHVRSFKGHSDKIQELAVSADNNFLVSVSEDGTARVFDISDFRCQVHNYLVPHTNSNQSFKIVTIHKFSAPKMDGGLFKSCQYQQVHSQSKLRPPSAVVHISFPSSKPSPSWRAFTELLAISRRREFLISYVPGFG